MCTIREAMRYYLSLKQWGNTSPLQESTHGTVVGFRQECYKYILSASRRPRVAHHTWLPHRFRHYSHGTVFGLRQECYMYIFPPSRRSFSMARSAWVEYYTQCINEWATYSSGRPASRCRQGFSTPAVLVCNHYFGNSHGTSSAQAEAYISWHHLKQWYTSYLCSIRWTARQTEPLMLNKPAPPQVAGLFLPTGLPCIQYRHVNTVAVSQDLDTVILKWHFQLTVLLTNE